MAMQEQMLRTPAAIVVANHCIGLFELAALHLGQNPPNLADAQVAIDALAGIIDAVGPRMGENGPPLRQALNQMRMAFVEAKTHLAAARDPVGPRAPAWSTAARQQSRISMSSVMRRARTPATSVEESVAGSRGAARPPWSTSSRPRAVSAIGVPDRGYVVGVGRRAGGSGWPGPGSSR